MRVIIRKLTGLMLIHPLPTLKKLNIGVQATFLSAIALSSPAFAEAPPSLPMLPPHPSDNTTIESLTEPPPSGVVTEPIDETNFPGAEVVPGAPSTANAIELNLPDLLNLVIQSNRELQNQVLGRIVQRNSLSQTEDQFSPRITPNFSIEAQGNLLDDESDTTTAQSLGVSSTLQTPLGTNITVSVDPIQESSWGSVSVNQPLLRGAGQAVNRAPIRLARIAEFNNILALQQQVIETITTSIQQYTNLIASQETVIIQAQALERRRQEQERLNALVEVGRIARVELINSEQLIASSERSLQEARNQLSRANTNLLNLIGAERVVQFVAPENAISQLFESASLRASEFDLDQLIAQAYETRRDYQQAQANLESQDLALLLAQDNRRWDLSWQSSASLGDATSPVRTGLQLTQTFGDRTPEDAVQSAQIDIVQQQNNFDQLTEAIRNEVTDQFGDVNSQLAQVEAAQRETEAARLQLEFTQARFSLGREINRLDISRSEESLVNAQNAELQARIGFINSIAQLERAVGTTLDTWQPVVDLRPVLASDEAASTKWPR